MAETEPEQGANTPEPPEAKPELKTFTQEQVNDLLARQKGDVQRRFADYDDLKQRAEKLAEIEAEKQTDLERLTSERDGLKETLTPLQTENLRLRVALDKKVPPPLIDRLKGGTKEEMEADADELLKFVGGKEPEPDPDFEGGARSTPPVQKKPEAAHNDFLAEVLGASGNT
jgi:hypothetical protein